MTTFRLSKKLLPVALIAAMIVALFACGAPAAVPNPPLVLGEKYLTDLDYEQALLQFVQAITIEPKNPRGYLGKADALLHLERQNEAASALGTGAKQCRAQRAALNEAKSAIEKSLVDGYIALSSAYEKLGWREIAIALLRRVCEELPEEGGLREALERLMNASESEATANRDITATTAFSIPEDVFNEKDMETILGPTWNTDMYAVAAKFGCTRAAVDEARRTASYEYNGESYHYYLAMADSSLDDIAFNVYGENGPQQGYDIYFNKNINIVGFPHGTRIGMSANEVISRFNSDSSTTDDPEGLYYYRLEGVNYSADFVKTEGTYDHITYSIRDMSNNTHQVGILEFDCMNGIVVGINLRVYTYPI